MYQGHIPENSNVGTKVILARKITAVDPDISDKSGVKLELHGKAATGVYPESWLIEGINASKAVAFQGRILMDSLC